MLLGASRRSRMISSVSGPSKTFPIRKMAKIGARVSETSLARFANCWPTLRNSRRSESSQERIERSSAAASLPLRRQEDTGATGGLPSSQRHPPVASIAAMGARTWNSMAVDIQEPLKPRLTGEVATTHMSASLLQLRQRRLNQLNLWS